MARPAALLNTRTGTNPHVLLGDIWFLYYASTNPSLYIYELVSACWPPHPPVRLLPPSRLHARPEVPRHRVPAEASFTITVLETRTDQNSFFMGSPLESTLDYPFSAGNSRARAKLKRSVGSPTRASNHQRKIREPTTDLNSPPVAATRAQFTVQYLHEPDTNGGAAPANQIRP